MTYLPLFIFLMSYFRKYFIECYKNKYALEITFRNAKILFFFFSKSTLCEKHKSVEQVLSENTLFTF